MKINIEVFVMPVNFIFTIHELTQPNFRFAFVVMIIIYSFQQNNKIFVFREQKTYLLNETKRSQGLQLKYMKTPISVTL